MLGEKVVKFVDDCIQGLNGYGALSLEDYCVLETAEPTMDHALVSRDGSLCTIVKVRGSLESRGEEDFKNFASQQDKGLKSKFASSGHMLQIVFDYDPTSAAREISDLYRPAQNTARRMGFDIDEIFDDWGKALAKHCAVENIYFVLWTTSSILSAKERSSANRKMRTGSAKTSPPLNKSTQNVAMFMPEISHQHDGYVSMVSDIFNTIGILSETLSGKEALRAIRRIIDSDFTDREWNAVLPGDKINIRYPDYGQDDADPALYLYPSLPQQLFPRPAVVAGRRVEIGDKYHQSIILESPPQHEESFMQLFKKMKDKQMPWRASFLIDSDGLKYNRLKSILAQVLSYGNSTNQKFVAAMEGLNSIKHSECIVRFRATFATWVHRNEEGGDESRLDSKLKARVSRLATVLQSWGSAQTTEMVGDGVLGFASTIPGLLQASPGPNVAAPLENVLYMMPTSRPASPWNEGSIILRTEDGKIMPFHPQSSKQSSWVDIGVAPMGQGKSVWLNSINFGFLFQPGLTELPYLSIIDIGPSSKGLVNLLRSLLPENRKHLAIYKRLKMHEDYSVNPFDTPLGCRKPLPNHKAYLVNLLALFATPVDQKASQDGIGSLASEVIDMAYNELADDTNPKLFNNTTAPEITELLGRLNYVTDEQTSWWEIIDFLFENNQLEAALSAQRFAVPLLPDLIKHVSKEIIASQYGFETPNKEPITKYFARAMKDAIASYPILKKPTRFDIGNARVVALDLDEVAVRGGAIADRTSAVMYMLARHITASKFFLMPTDVELMPSRYRAYHKNRIESIRKNPKRLAYDEFHRVSGNESLAKQIVGDLETAVRESRKWLLSVGLYSQNITDISEIMIELATQIFIFGAGDEKSLDVLKKRFGLSTIVEDQLRHLGKPGAKGANMIAIFKTDAGKVVHQLTNTLGAVPLWAFSSTSEDMSVRDALYDLIGVKETLSNLAKIYPGGVKKEVERRRHADSSDNTKDRGKDILKEIVNEIHKQALENGRGERA